MHIPNESALLRRERQQPQDCAADAITRFAGSMLFVYLHVGWFMLWVVYNVAAPRAFDKFPFGLLTLIVSLEAIFLSTFVMISQNREAQRSEIRAQLDFETNVLGEVWTEMIAARLGIDVREVHEKVAERMPAATAFGAVGRQLARPEAAPHGAEPDRRQCGRDQLPRARWPVRRPYHRQPGAPCRPPRHRDQGERCAAAVGPGVRPGAGTDETAGGWPGRRRARLAAAAAPAAVPAARRLPGPGRRRRPVDRPERRRRPRRGLLRRRRPVVPGAARRPGPARLRHRSGKRARWRRRPLNGRRIDILAFLSDATRPGLTRRCDRGLHAERLGAQQA